MDLFITFKLRYILLDNRGLLIKDFFADFFNFLETENIFVLVNLHILMRKESLRVSVDWLLDTFFIYLLALQKLLFLHVLDNFIINCRDLYHFQFIIDFKTRLEIYLIANGKNFLFCVFIPEIKPVNAPKRYIHTLGNLAWVLNFRHPEHELHKVLETYDGACYRPLTTVSNLNFFLCMHFLKFLKFIIS